MRPIRVIEPWLPDLAQARGAKYQAIADAVTGAIGRGELRAGDRLPPQRELAAALGVDLTTVTKAYDWVRHRGLIEARGRAGSFVRDPAAGVPPERAFADTGMNMPPEIGSGMLRKAMAETAAALLAAPGSTRLHYQPAGGSPQDRAAGAEWLTSIGLASAEEQVIVTAGGQNALHGVLSATLAPGDAVACGRFVYSGFKALAARLGLRLVALPEMRAAALEEACGREEVKALYVVPTNDNPTAVTLPLAERQAIADVAQRFDLQVIEDDAYGPLAAEPIAPIASFAPERCWHVASMSKIISPALRWLMSARRASAMR
jgi:DNA-binding transcriptional MocR family regulator